jgi:hypothetical protein
MMHTQTTRKMAANEGGRGNLAGTEITCTCGHRISTTLDSQVSMLIWEHADYMERVGNARHKANATKHKAAATRKRNSENWLHPSYKPAI